MVQNDRAYWCEMLQRVGQPVLDAMAEGQLKQKMPIERSQDSEEKAIRSVTYLEALGRLLSGMAPWLENQTLSGEEEVQRAAFAKKARTSIEKGTDPKSADYLNFREGRQPIVDAAFLSHAILRAPTELWEKLDSQVKGNVAACLKQTRPRKPAFNNWLLFAAMTEAALRFMGEDWDPMRIDFALKQHEQWYVGDGMYGDGPEFHWDYYNSFVIQPMLVDLLKQVGSEFADWSGMMDQVDRRAQRYAAVQERLINPDGTFPAIGRSLVYRCGAFQHLAQMALQHNLPSSLNPQQVRCALTAVIQRTLEPKGTFDENGWLRIGLAGHQPELGESYISTGSLYLCSTAFLPLGLPSADPFWQGEAEWTSRLIWAGERMQNDKAFKK